MSTDAFRRELAQLINRHSLENGSNTPDHVLALFLDGCLHGFGAAVVSRDGLRNTAGFLPNQEFEERIADLEQRCKDLEAELAKAREWSEDDKPTEFDEQIKAEAGYRGGNPDRYARALEVVGKKRSKYALVDLVNWWMFRAETAEDAFAKAPRRQPSDVLEIARLEAAFENGNKWLDEVTAERDQLRAEKEKLREALETCHSHAMIWDGRHDCAGARCGSVKALSETSGPPDPNQESAKALRKRLGFPPLSEEEQDRNLRENLDALSNQEGETK